NKIVLADDDIRYAPSDIEQILAMLDDFEVVRPQNYLALKVGQVSNLPVRLDGKLKTCSTIPARMEAARMLINRATLGAADYPGTCAFRRDAFLRAGDYDGDVLFDNEELIRHLARFGAKICYANNLFIRKRP